MDSAPPQSAGLNLPAAPDAESAIADISGLSAGDLWREAEAESVALTKLEWANALLSVGTKYNYGSPPGTAASPAQAAAFWRGLQLRDLALAHACALGRDVAWDEFLSRYRAPLKQAAIALTKSASLGQELADSLVSEMFGLGSHDGERRSPLASYAGRGSLLGFLRTTLAQRFVDHHRRTHREMPLGGKDFPSASVQPSTAPEVLAKLAAVLSSVLSALDAEARFLLSAWYLDQHTLLDISKLLRVHEATVSRKLKRLTEQIHKELLHSLQSTGLSRRAAEEALGIDPRDLTINIRSLLQNSQTATFYKQKPEPEAEKA